MSVISMISIMVAVSIMPTVATEPMRVSDRQAQQRQIRGTIVGRVRRIIIRAGRVVTRLNIDPLGITWLTRIRFRIAAISIVVPSVVIARNAIWAVPICVPTIATARFTIRPIPVRIPAIFIDRLGIGDNG